MVIKISLEIVILLNEDGDGDDSRSFEDQNTKKVRFEDVSDAPEVDMAMDLDPSPKISMSWKDKLLGVGSIDSNKEFMESDDGRDANLILLEDDVIRTTFNGIQAIDFSDQVKQIVTS
ncbi:hypothetical protein PVK06_017348 [Gossypium arboreum]|uniref:Uncharacterized protein n=1 Tax=Gossypium arboreum TaxID=29729 RepID=A0ABR0Q2G9_GOSAR|nr:hypothetical protein PVK06_017348 [Gossypium arboreum]